MGYNRNLPDSERLKILSDMLDKRQCVIIADGNMRIIGTVSLVVNNGVTNYALPGAKS